MSDDEFSGSASVDSQLLELQNDYIAGLRGRITPLMNAWQKCVNSDYAADSLQEVYRSVHAIAGTSSMLNVSPVDVLSNKAQVLIHGLMNTDDRDSALFIELDKTLKTLELAVLSGEVKAPPINLNG